MQIPIEITFRDMERSDAVEAAIREKAEKLERFYDKIMSCHVMVEAPHGHHHQGRLFQVRIDLTVPDAELVVNREHHHRDHSHEDVYVAIRDAFNAMQRQVQDYARQHPAALREISRLLKIPYDGSQESLSKIARVLPVVAFHTQAKGPG